MSDKCFVSYFRVSTDKQGKSGLGIEAQRAAVAAFVAGRGAGIVSEYVEIESGKHDDRPQLARALAECRLRGCTLVISKLDRLSRNAAFLINLRDSGANFVCVDMPEANNFTVGIMALVAQQEREAISSRTKEALAARKARGLPLGNPANLTAVARATGQVAGNAAKSARAASRKADLLPIIAELQAADITSLKAIAAKLNEKGIKTARGGQWTATQVKRLFS